jgi:hypothetical protein
MHTVSIAPASPRANETITVTIHPRWRLRRGCFYEVLVTIPKAIPEMA